MGKINSLSESWKDHTFEEVEEFVRDEIGSLEDALDDILHPEEESHDADDSWDNEKFSDVETDIKGKFTDIDEKIKEAYGDLAEPLTFEAVESGTTIYFRQSLATHDEGIAPLSVEFSTDNGETWTKITALPDDGSQCLGAVVATLDSGEKVLLRGNNEVYGDWDLGYELCNFWADSGCYVYGNIMSLVGGEDFARLREVKEGAFYFFFSDGDASKDWSWVLSKIGKRLILPATTLAQYCYSNMFSGCTALVTAPALPATTLAENCCSYMFSNCASLTSAPSLPATTMAEWCYNYMFQDCTSLVTAPALPATTMANGCYSAMFFGCASLTTAPALPATTLAQACYNTMFNGCTNLSYIKAMFTTTPGSSYTKNWVKNVKSTGTFAKNSAATWNVSGVDGIPSGWTVETADA